MKRIIIWLLAMLVIVSAPGMAAPDLSNSGGGSWQYYRDVNISEKSGSTLTDYQIHLQLSSNNFTNGAQIYGEDIRFMDAKGNELSYWIEYWDAIAGSARMWVKVNIPQRGSTGIRMYYGNPNASSSSNGSRTFIFFDDFQNNDLAANWEIYTIRYNISSEGLKTSQNFSENSLNVSEFEGQQIISGSTLRNSDYEYGKGLRTVKSFTPPLIYEIDRISINPLGDGVLGFIHLYQDDNNWYSYGGGINRKNEEHKIFRVSKISRVPLETFSDDVGDIDDYGFHVFRIVHDGTNVKFYMDNVLEVSENVSTLNNLKIGTSSWLKTDVSTIKVVFDNARVRKYATQEPTIEVGPAIPIATPTPLPTTPPTPLPTTPPTPLPTISPTTTPIIDPAVATIVTALIGAIASIIVAVLALKKK
ncbi:MAG: DUF2341 domain-containing protein [Candidatus Methanoperedens sp.]|nr:DUF2341 domain-containing protein [Candidatus Methanoperedens sp.]MCZ7371685.1 DUF2341 domain-containing protein [Candidatus Methanoperedens sp.]